MFSFIRWLAGPAARPAAKAPRRRPSVEALEDRCVPASFDFSGPLLEGAGAALAGLRRELAAEIGSRGDGLVDALRGAQHRPQAPRFETEVVARGLLRPTGIVARDGVLYFTQIPTPGVGGGANSVEMFDVASGTRRTLHMGEPEPRNITRTADGTLYWTCTSAGVILSQTPAQAATNEVTLVRSGLSRPVGITVTPDGRSLYWTEVPSPGVAGGTNPNTIHRLNLRSGQEMILHTGAAEPADLAVDRYGNVYFTDRAAGRIMQVRHNGHARVLLRGLDKPVGLAIDHRGENLYFTEVPTPGVSGRNGGRNTVNVLDLRTLRRTVIDSGDPEPTDLAVDRDGSVYWTCTSAGVIVKATPVGRR